MIVMPRPVLEEIEAAAAAAYPEECCGLLAGRREPSGDVVVTRAQPSPNVAQGDRRERFEVDPQVRFDLMRDLQGGALEIIGVYHSHPDHPAEPSANDLKMAFEPDLVWLITAVNKGRAQVTTAHALAAGGGRFTQVEMSPSQAEKDNP